MGVHVKVAGAWQEIGVDGGGGVPWAKVTGGTVTEYTAGDGSVMEVHTFTASGTLTVESPGYAEVLLVGGGAGNTGADSGAGGDIAEGMFALPAGANAVVVGAGGANSNSWGAFPGKASKLGTLQTFAAALYGGAGAVEGTLETMQTGRVSTITGTPVTYGTIKNAPAANTGDGALTGGQSGGSGIVIVAVQKSPPTESGVVASGGTETTFVGDGVNGVLGQTYKVHTFTSPTGTLTVTQGGDAEVFMISGGSGSMSASHSGGGGSPWEGKVTLGAGAIPVVVGEGGQAGVSWNTWACPGKESSLGGIKTSIGEAAFGAGATSGNPQAEITVNIDGTAKGYGLANAGTVRANRGDGQSSQAFGSAGVVIVRYPIATP